MARAQVQKEAAVYTGALFLESLYPRTFRRGVTYFLYVSTIALGVVVLIYIAEHSLRIGAFSWQSLFDGSGTFFFGLFQISFALMYFHIMLSAYYNAKFYRGIEAITHEDFAENDSGVTYEVGSMLASGSQDLTKAFCNSKYGAEILARCNVNSETLDKFLQNKEATVPPEVLDDHERAFVAIEDVAKAVYENDGEFSDFLFREGIGSDTFFGATKWAMQRHHLAKHDTRWWSRDNLGKVVPIGRDWALGTAFMLERYSRNIKTTAVFSVIASDIAYADEKVSQIETVLSRAKNANVIVVGEPGVGKMDIVMRLSERMEQGESSPALVGKRIIVLNTETFIAEHESSEELEHALVQLFTQSTNAGNVVLAIDRFPEFLAHAASAGVNAIGILDSFLASDQLQFIVTSDPGQFHGKIEARANLLARFGVVHIETPSRAASVQVLQSVATASERKYGVIFTYPAVEAIVESADRYITEGAMPDKAVDLLAEIAPNAAREGAKRITKEYVYTYVQTKTGVPVGPVREEEREELLNLESVLHERVIGQDKAVTAVAGVMRRVRAGIQDENRPLGSFMFLGSTGVGKTETAKALAHVFFGADDAMSRIDMSEYSGIDALERLIGTGDEKAGDLTVLLKERPYGVLLLDELEKASRSVHDLFLQILDEGSFTDARGQKVNARNVIIIATTNAGADLVWQITKNHENPNDHRDEIVDHIIEGGIFRPEFLNRFDGVVIFEPLSIDSQEKIAQIMLEGLAERVKQKGYELVIDQVLISAMVQKGYDPEFGARPMRRVMQDIIEEKIATKIIEGGLKPGDKVWFYDEDFRNQK